MNPRFHKDVIAKVKQRIQKISQGRLRRPGVADSLVKMNIPPLAGRRDAIYLQAEKILTEELSVSSPQECEKHYGLALQLLDSAIKDSMTILGAMPAEEAFEAREQEIAGFLRLLRNIVQAILDTLNFCSPPHRRQEESATMTERSKSPQLVFPDFSKNVENNAGQIEELLKKSHEQLAEYRNLTVKSFDRNGIERYQAAFKSYSKISDNANPD